MNRNDSSSFIMLLVFAAIVAAAVKYGPEIKQQIYQNMHETVGRSSRISTLEKEIAQLKKENEKAKKQAAKQELEKLKEELAQTKKELAKGYMEADTLAKKAPPAPVAVAAAKAVPTPFHSTYVQRRYVSQESRPAPQAAAAYIEDRYAANDPGMYEDLSSDLAVSPPPRPGQPRPELRRVKSAPRVEKKQAALEEDEDDIFGDDKDLEDVESSRKRRKKRN